VHHHLEERGEVLFASERPVAKSQGRGPKGASGFIPKSDKKEEKNRLKSSRPSKKGPFCSCLFTLGFHRDSPGEMSFIPIEYYSILQI
jgi:hypothetical protein